MPKGCVTERRPYSRHGLNAAMVRVKLRGFRAIDRRTAGARAALAFRDELLSALGGEAEVSPQRRKLVELAVRASLMLDHVDAWLLGRESLVNARSRTLLPVLVQRQALAEHLAKVLDRLGLDRAPKPVPALDAYIRSRYGPDEAAGEASPEPTVRGNGAAPGVRDGGPGVASSDPTATAPSAT